VKQVGPSVPAEILGIGGLPEAGDIFEVAPNERTARQTAEQRARELEAQRGFGTRVTLEDVHARIESGEVKALNLIVKTDVQGSVEAVRTALEPLTTEQTRVNLLRVATGSITESDVLLAEASQAIILGFNSQPEPGARTLGSQGNIEIRYYDIIYNLIDDVEKGLEGLLEPVSRDVVEGYATVRAVFNVGRRAKAAGIYVNEGRISRGAEIHVLRGGKKLFTGSMTSLKHFKDDVREIATAVEGGIVLDGFSDYQEGDILEAHRTEQVG
jgi:translation initiation factor IF-2